MEKPEITFELTKNSITCLVCLHESFNYNDMLNLYCGFCHAYHYRPNEFYNKKYIRHIQHLNTLRNEVKQVENSVKSTSFISLFPEIPPRDQQQGLWAKLLAAIKKGFL